MYKLLLVVLIPLHLVWSVQIVGIKEAANRWSVRFSHIPSVEKIGAFKVTLRFNDNVDLSSISTDVPLKGAWSQIKPALARNGNSAEVMCVGPAMLNSRLTDTLEMFHLAFDFSGAPPSGSEFKEILDSVRFSECFDIHGNEIVPQMNIRTAVSSQIKRGAGRSGSIRFSTIGRIHSLSFLLTDREMVRARVVDIRGRLVTNLIEKHLEPGMHTLRWPKAGRSMATGTYFIQLEINNFTYNKKVNYYR